MKKLFFLHIPKTAGSSINTLMREWFGKTKSLVHLESHPAWRSRTLDIDAYDFLSGHITWPAQQTRLNRQWKTLVFLRRPDAQLASHIAWVRRLAEPTEKEKLKRQPSQILRIVEQLALRNLADPDHLRSLVSWLDDNKAFLFHNTQTQYLSGVASPTTGAVRTAFLNMAAMSFVAITERLDEAMCMLADKIGKPLRTAKAPVENAHPETFGLDISCPETLAALGPLTCYDWLTYDRARELFVRHFHEWLGEIELRSSVEYSTTDLPLVIARLNQLLGKTGTH